MALLSIFWTRTCIWYYLSSVSVSFGLLQFWLSCFSLTVWETLCFSSETETHFVQCLERKEKIHLFYCKGTNGFFLVYVKGRCYYWCFPYLSIQLMFFPCNLFSLIYLWSYYFFPKNKWLKFCSSLQAKPVTVNEFCLVQKSFIKCSSSITKQCGSSIWGFLYPLLYSSDLKSHFALWFKLCRQAWKL